MALYGPGTPVGFVPFTGFSPTLGATDAIAPVTAGNVQFDGMTQNDDMLSKLMFKRANGSFKRLLIALTGAAFGGTATEAYSRVTAVAPFTSQFQGGGVMLIESVSQINRVTTATDVTNLKAAFARTPSITFVADVSGNGGGGHGGF